MTEQGNCTDVEVALGGGEVERGVEAPEGGVARERWAELEQHARLDGVPVPRRRHQPLAGRGAPQRVPHRPPPPASGGCVATDTTTGAGAWSQQAAGGTSRWARRRRGTRP
jgi:hypothetical protein